MLASVLMYKQLVFSSSMYLSSLSYHYIAYRLRQVDNRDAINNLLLSSTNHQQVDDDIEKIMV